VFIRNEKIHSIGSLHTLKLTANNPEYIDLKGYTLLPAFTDAHTHFVETAKQQLTLNVLDCVNTDDFFQRLKYYRDNYQQMLDRFGYSGRLDWIKGFGWEKKLFDKCPDINKNLIDSVFPDIPVSIASRDLHSNLCNSKALEIIGINENQHRFSANGIEIGRFVDGEPNGYLYENSWTILEKFIPKQDDNLIKKLVIELIRKSQKMGLCGVHSLESRRAAELICDICDDHDFYFVWYYLNLNEIKEKVFDYKSHFLSEKKHFTNGGIKIFSDGSLGSDSAWLYEQIECGKLNTNNDVWLSYIEKLKNEIICANKQGLQVAVHAIGDYAVFQMADIIHKLNKDFPNAVKHRIEHLQAVLPTDIALLTNSRVHASMQPVHMKTDIEVIKKKWVKAQHHSFPLKSIMQNMALALGSDTPVETMNPFEGIRYATYRDGFGDNEAISLPDAINAYTTTHHTVANKEIKYGMISEGQIANLIVVHPDTFSDPTKICTETKMTIINGKIVN
jgi:hypothetical protein